MLEERGKNSFQKFVYVALIDNKKGNFRQKLPLGNQDIQIDLNRSHVRRKSPYWYSRKALGVIYRYRLYLFNIRGDDFNVFLQVISHEMGHIFGLGDAYRKSEEKSKNWQTKYMVGAKITDEVPKDDMMNELGIITPNDIEMILEAWRSTFVQNYYNASLIGYRKSSVIRQEQKDKTN